MAASAPQPISVERKVDTPKDALESTFVVYKLALPLQCLVFIGGEIMVRPNFSGKATRFSLQNYSIECI